MYQPDRGAAAYRPLIGTPPGYVGFDDGGYLTDPVIKAPDRITDLLLTGACLRGAVTVDLAPGGADFAVLNEAISDSSVNLPRTAATWCITNFASR